MASGEREVVPLQRGPSAEELQAAMAVIAAAGMVVAPSPAARRASFMRVWIEREREVRDALRERSGRWAFFMDVLRLAVGSLPLDSQRMSVSQADFALNEGLSASEASRAFQALAEVGAVLLKRRAGKSVTWEIDAEYASRLSEDRRNAELARQRQEVARDRAVAARKAVAAGVKLREVPIEAPSRVEDAAQPELL